MRLLILGGSTFVGRHLVDSALGRGHAVTVFNRGKSPARLPAAVERLIGDRNFDLSALHGRRWDSVVDTCGYVPGVVRDSARLLADAAEHYTFVSSISVYAAFESPGMDESAPLAVLPENRLAEIEAARAAPDRIVAAYAEDYGALKALCERTVESYVPGRALHVRAGLIVGPGDYMDRLPWWVRRVTTGGDVLAPGSPRAPLQLVDARDLVGWIVRMAESRAAGIFNATGPDRELTLGELLETCREVTGSAARLLWVDDGFLQENGVTPWTELPLWIPQAGHAGFMRVDCHKAFAAGLTFRPLIETVRDVASENASGVRAAGSGSGADPRLSRGGRTGLDPAKERELLRVWSAVRTSGTAARRAD
jgi:2'-hydroxyisoflavone reductase